ncbi:MAG: TMEM165/GDT1 family protein [Erythrobacter sp.]|nr:TMEM165/GDT1 family protein [Erythrobacter sp.]
MDAFLFTLLLVVAVSLGGRDQLIVARLSEALQQSWPLLAVGAVVSSVSAGLMALAGATLADILPPRAADMLVAFALAIAAFELFWPVRLKAMEEPTRSLGAAGIVLLARQVGDAARFVIFAFAAEATYPLVTVIGGAIGGFAALSIGWTMGARLERQIPLRPIRLAIGACLIIAALVIGLNARYVFL